MFTFPVCIFQICCSFRCRLELYRKVPNLRILACGGDGTVSYFLNLLCGPPWWLINNELLKFLHLKINRQVFCRWRTCKFWSVTYVAFFVSCPGWLGFVWTRQAKNHTPTPNCSASTGNRKWLVKSAQLGRGEYADWASLSSCVMWQLWRSEYIKKKTVVFILARADGHNKSVVLRQGSTGRWYYSNSYSEKLTCYKIMFCCRVILMNHCLEFSRTLIKEVLYN